MIPVSALGVMYDIALAVRHSLAVEPGSLRAASIGKDRACSRGSARKITALATSGDFNRFLAEKRYGELIVLMLKRDLKLLPENLEQEVLAAMPGDADEATVVARLRDDALTRSPRFDVNDP